MKCSACQDEIKEIPIIGFQYCEKCWKYFIEVLKKEGITEK